MLNNKGFAVSTVLYTLLIAFLLFLGAMLASFSSSNSIISNANNDLINGSKLSVVQVKDNNQEGKCVSIDTEKKEGDYYWYEVKSGILAKINTRYGVMYWPRDFAGEINDKTIKYKSSNNKIEVSDDATALEDDVKEIIINGSNTFELTVKDIKTNEEASVIIGDICG